MNEDFDPETEDFYSLHCDADDADKSNQSFLFDFENMKFKDSSIFSTPSKPTPNCCNSNYHLEEEVHFPEKSNIEIKNNPKQNISIDENNKRMKRRNQFNTKNRFGKYHNNIPILSNRNHFSNQPHIISNLQKYRVYFFLFKITGAYLTQNELIYLRKTIFKDIFPLATRDEQRSKLKNIECFEKNHDKIIPFLLNPNIQATIQQYIMSKRKKYEQLNMIENIYSGYHIVNFKPKKMK